MTPTPATTMHVSVIVPTKDRSGYLAVALDSIDASLAAAADAHGITHEVIVVDDGSTDDTMAMLAEREAIALTNRGSGVSAGRNTGIDAATGDLVLFLDDDDAWTLDHVSLHVAAHLADDSIGVSYSQGLLADAELTPVSDPQPEGPLPGGWIQEALLNGKVQSFTTFAVRREVFDEAGRFDEALFAGEDLEFVQRMGTVATFHPIEQATVVWRQFPRPARGLDGWKRLRDQDRTMRRITAERAAEFGLSRRWRLQRALSGRGWTFHSAMQEADRCRAEGLDREVRRLLVAGFTTSPLHAVKDRRFWAHLRGLVRR